MKLSVADGKLYVDNLDDSSEDSYALIMDSDYLKKVCNQDYTYEYDVTYRDAGEYFEVCDRCFATMTGSTITTRWICVSAATVTTRRGTGIRGFIIMIRPGPLRATDDTAIITQLFGDEFQEDGMLLKDRKVTVRVETSIEKGPTVYVNGVKASDMQANQDQWNTIDSYAICFKASKSLRLR